MKLHKEYINYKDKNKILNNNIQIYSLEQKYKIIKLKN